MLDAREVERRESIPYCAGLPLIEDRLMTPGERAELKYFARKRFWQGLGLFLGIPVVTLILCFLLAWWSTVWDGAVIILVLLLSVSLVAGILAILHPESYLQQSLRLFGDLKQGYIREFSGEVTYQSESNGIIQQLMAKHLIDQYENWIGSGLRAFPTDQTLTLVVLPVSHRLWSINGIRCKPYIYAVWHEVAKHASQVTLEQNARSGDVRCHLTRSECQEIARYAREAWLKPLPLAIALTIWLVLVINLSGTTSSKLELMDWLRIHGLVIAMLGSVIVLILGIISARNLYKDIRNGYVEVHTLEDKVEQLRQQSGGRFISAWEILPVSKRRWSEDSKPASWRRNNSDMI